MPGTEGIPDGVCFFRHALALDERRVKFLPLYINGGASEGSSNTSENAAQSQQQATDDRQKIAPRIKEVWFSGCHSDMFVFLLHYHNIISHLTRPCGRGGCRPISRNANSPPHISDPPLHWMLSEARAAGLYIEQRRDPIMDPTALKAIKLKDSLSFVWSLLEPLPFKRLTYKTSASSTWYEVSSPVVPF